MSTRGDDSHNATRDEEELLDDDPDRTQASSSAAVSQSLGAASSRRITRSLLGGGGGGKRNEPSQSLAPPQFLSAAAPSQGNADEPKKKSIFDSVMSHLITPSAAKGASSSSDKKSKNKSSTSSSSSSSSSSRSKQPSNVGKNARMAPPARLVSSSSSTTTTSQPPYQPHPFPSPSSISSPILAISVGTPDSQLFYVLHSLVFALAPAVVAFNTPAGAAANRRGEDEDSFVFNLLCNHPITTIISAKLCTPIGARSLTPDLLWKLISLPLSSISVSSGDSFSPPVVRALSRTVRVLLQLILLKQHEAIAVTKGAVRSVVFRMLRSWEGERPSSSDASVNARSVVAPQQPTAGELVTSPARNPAMHYCKSVVLSDALELLLSTSSPQSVPTSAIDLLGTHITRYLYGQCASASGNDVFVAEEGRSDDDLRGGRHHNAAVAPAAASATTSTSGGGGGNSSERSSGLLAGDDGRRSDGGSADNPTRKKRRKDSREKTKKPEDDMPRQNVIVPANSGLGIWPCMSSEERAARGEPLPDMEDFLVDYAQRLKIRRAAKAGGGERDATTAASSASGAASASSASADIGGSGGAIEDYERGKQEESIGKNIVVRLALGKMVMFGY